MSDADLPSYILFLLLHIMVSCDYMSYLVGVLYEGGTAYPSGIHGFTPGFFMGSVLLIGFIFLLCVFCFVNILVYYAYLIKRGTSRYY
jgi:hypothetical protein